VQVTRRNRAHVVEVEPSGLRWIKSSASSSSGEECVELASAGDVVLVRHSRNRSGARLLIPAHSWAAFVARAAAG
jgi:hypothetical protein